MAITQKLLREARALSDTELLREARKVNSAAVDELLKHAHIKPRTEELEAIRGELQSLVVVHWSEHGR